MAKYRKLECFVDAVQWTGKNYDEVKQFLDIDCIVSLIDDVIYFDDARYGRSLHVSKGDWVVKDGNFYTCIASVFPLLFDRVSEEDDAAITRVLEE